MELHTYSSLNKDFLVQYKGTMEKADDAIVFYSNHALEIKKLKNIDKNIVAESFDKQGIEVFNDKNNFKNKILFMELDNTVLLFLSSGNFDGIDLQELTNKLLDKIT